MKLLKLIRAKQLFAQKRLVFKKGGGEVPTVAEAVKPMRVSQEKLGKMNGTQLEDHLLKHEQRINKIASRASKEGYQDRADAMREKYRKIAATLTNKHSLLQINGAIDDGKTAEELAKDAEGAREALKNAIEEVKGNLEWQKTKAIARLKVAGLGDAEYESDLAGLEADIKAIKVSPEDGLTLSQIKSWAKVQSLSIASKSHSGPEYAAISSRESTRKQVRAQRESLGRELGKLAAAAKEAGNTDLLNQMTALQDTLTTMMEPAKGSSKEQWQAYSIKLKSHYDGSFKYYAEKTDQHEREKVNFEEQEREYASVTKDIEDKRDAIEDKISFAGFDKPVSKVIRDAAEKAIAELDALEKGLKEPTKGDETILASYQTAKSRADLAVNTFQRVELKQDVYDNGGKELVEGVVDKADSFASIEEFNKAFDAALAKAVAALTPGKYDKPNPDDVAKLAALKQHAAQLRSNVVGGMYMKAVAEKGYKWANEKIAGVKDWINGAPDMLAKGMDWLKGKGEQVAGAFDEAGEAAKEQAYIKATEGMITKALGKIITSGPGAKRAERRINNLLTALWDKNVDRKVAETVRQELQGTMGEYVAKLDAYKTRLGKRGLELADSGDIVRKSTGKVVRRAGQKVRARAVAASKRDVEGAISALKEFSDSKIFKDIAKIPDPKPKRRIADTDLDDKL